MNKRELVREVATLTACTKSDVDTVISVFLEVVKKTVAKGEPVGLQGFGTFGARDRAPRVGRNPNTGERVPIPACRKPIFTASSDFKAVVNK